MKYCKAKNHWVLDEEFGIRNCKECHAEKMRQWRQENPERARKSTREAKKRWRAAHPEDHNEQQREYRKRHPDTVRTIEQRYRDKKRTT
jgi:hypothetical protein